MKSQAPRLTVLTIVSSLLFCCGIVPADEKKVPSGEVGEPDSTIVCPVYSWMEWGGYCSYYALSHPTCEAVGFDSADCDLPPAGCTEGSSEPDPNCFTVLLSDLKGSGRSGDPGRPGYGGPKRGRVVSNPVPGSNPRLIVRHNRRRDRFCIYFQHPNDDALTIYAQLWKADVKVRGGSRDWLTFRRGNEISRSSAATDANDHVEPVAGRPHCFRYTHPDDGWSVDIVTHEGTPPHDS